MLNPILTVFGRAVLVCCLALGSPIVVAQELDVPVMELADGTLDTCANGKIVGLKSDGDGFLAVRSGPAGSFSKIDELYNGDDVWLFERNGEWIGVIYDAIEITCSPIDSDRPVPHEGKQGWVHESWVELIAG